MDQLVNQFVFSPTTLWIALTLVVIMLLGLVQRVVLEWMEQRLRS